MGISTPSLARRECTASVVLTPSATIFISPRMSSSFWPLARCRPTCRLRERSPVQVSTRSPMPDRPMKVERSPPMALPSLLISCRPRVMSAARALPPKPRPSATPAAMATMFLIAPPSSTPRTSDAV